MANSAPKAVNTSVNSSNKDSRTLGSSGFNEDYLDSEIEDYLNEKAVESKDRFWSTTGDGSLFWAANDVAKTIDPGLYKAITTDRTGPALMKLIAHTDDLLVLESVVQRLVVREIERFWTPFIKNNYKTRGFLYKRGILMYGDPGSGKTSALQMLIKKVIDKGGIAIQGEDPGVLIGCLQMARRIEPDRPIVVILEDFETLTDQSRRENEWLAVMDGEAQVDNVVFLATTNYIEKLDKRFTDRPSRFDVVVKVPMPSATDRAHYLRYKEPSMTLEEIQDWVSQTKNFSMAHLKEVIISVKILGKDLKETIERMREMQKRSYSNEEFKSTETGEKVGFGFNAKVEQTTEEKVDWNKFKEETFPAESEPAVAAE